MINNKHFFLFLSWRDIKSPKAGGAELHTHDVIRVMNKDKYDAVSFTPRYKGLLAEETIDGVKYLRRGNAISVIFWAFIYYLKNRNTIDYVVEQCNTHRFFTKLWVSEKKRIFYIHQLTREIWDINMKFPFNKIGKILETPMLRLQRKDFVFTVSQSTKQDLIDVGFDEKKIMLIPNAIEKSFLGIPLDDEIDQKQHDFVYVGRYSKYKGIDASIEALGIVRKTYKDSKLRIVGKIDEMVVKEVIEPFSKKYGFTFGKEADNDIVLCGFVSEEDKYSIMKNSLALLFPSIREGWGLIVTEAAAMGTPSIVYDNPGCRDAVNYGKAGYMCSQNTPENLAEQMIICIENKKEYEEKRKAAYDYAQRFSWKNNTKIIDDILFQIVSAKL